MRRNRLIRCKKEYGHFLSPLKLIINRDYKNKTYYFVRFSIKSAHFFNHLIDERWETGNSDRDELIDYLRWNRDASCACNMVSYFIVFEYSNSVSSMLFVPYRWNGGGGWGYRLSGGRVQSLSRFVSYMYPVPNFLLLCAELIQTWQMMSFR